ncbi:MAG: hypothetical protein HY000_00500 [Planctomycetes bacterium]|nr:hypothetical protein [Planctomycetota bacterium]
MFFEGRDQVHRTFGRITSRLQKANIPYAIVGAMALAAHHYRRATTDVDILLTPEGFEEFQKRLVPKQYGRVRGRKRRFVDRVNAIGIDILVTGLFPGTGKPGPIAYPHPDDVSELVDDKPVVNLRTLVELKLAARRWRDFADVVELIRFNDLDESFAQKLHPSVRSDYIECLEEKRREDEYEARQ